MLEVNCMKIHIAIALIEAIFSYFCIALGFVLQKKGIDWLGYQGEKGRRYHSNLQFWLAGLVLLILAGIPNYLALQVLNVQMINAFSSLNIVFMIFLSKLVLKEKLFLLDYVYTLIICSAILLINLVDHGAALTVIAGYAFLAAALPIGLFLIWILLRVVKVLKHGSGLQAILLAVLGGCMSGLMPTFMKILQIQWGAQFFSYLISPYLYCFLIVSLLSQVALQVAYKMGKMIPVGSAQYATTVFYPILAAYPISQLPIRPVQGFCFIVIVVTVVLMVCQHNKQPS
jgi:uncharacterized membrane protein